jgi:hypothetical protein
MFRLQSKPFPVEIPYLNISKNPLQAVPTGSGRINVVDGFRWKNSGSTEEVPSVCLIEYELEFGVWTQMLARIANTINVAFNQGELDPYSILYNGNPTGFEYNFPLLIKNGDKIRSIRNSWGETDFSLNKFLGGSGKASKNTFGNILGKGLALGVGLMGDMGFEEVQQFKGTQAETLTVTFPLYNTVSLKEAYNNHMLVSLLTFQNLKTRNTFLTYIPPKIYKVKTQNCLGGLDWPAAYISSLDIESIGTTRELSEFGNTTILIPEAYKVSITITQLVATSSNIFAGAIGENSVNVIGSIKNVVTESVTEGIGAVTETLRNSSIAAGAVPTSNPSNQP